MVSGDFPEKLAEESRRQGIWVDKTLYSVIKSQTTERPNETAIRSRDVELTYDELFERIDQIAAFLAAQGVAERDNVTVQFPGWWQICGVHLATSRVGGRFLSLHDKWRQSETVHLLDKTDTNVWMIPESYKGFDYLEFAEEVATGVDSLEAIVVFRDDACTDLDVRGVDVYNEADVFEEDWSDGSNILTERSPPSPTDDAYVMTSSGTTNLPSPSLWSETTSMHSSGTTATRPGWGPTTWLVDSRRSEPGRPATSTASWPH